ncbi:MAG: hypothetical protein AAGD05_11090 [Bacteroidota bacterium]
MELNLLLTLLLRAAGLEAHPALMSTKKHGLVSKVYPVRTQFNHVLAAVKINGRYQLLDAIDPFRPYDVLPAEDLNELALLLHKKPKAKWIKIRTPPKSRRVLTVNIDYRQEKSIQGDVTLSTSHYESIHHRRQYYRSEDKQQFVRTQMLTDERFTIDSLAVKNLNKVTAPLEISCTFKAEKEEMGSSEFIYINPYLYKDQQHPFKSPNRQAPIDFYYAKSHLYLFNLLLPEGYMVEELPSPQKLVLSERTCMLKSSARVDGNQVQVVLELSFNDSFFPVKEYQALRQLFDAYISKQEQQIVLKKT